MSLKRITSCLALLIVAIAATAQATATPTTADHGPRFAYLGSDLPAQCIYQYRVQPSGALAPLKPSKINVGSQPCSLIAAPSGRYVYMAHDGDSSVEQLKVTPLWPVAPAQPCLRA